MFSVPLHRPPFVQWCVLIFCVSGDAPPSSSNLFMVWTHDTTRMGTGGKCNKWRTDAASANQTVQETTATGTGASGCDGDVTHDTARCTWLKVRLSLFSSSHVSFMCCRSAAQSIGVLPPDPTPAPTSASASASSKAVVKPKPAAVVDDDEDDLVAQLAGLSVAKGKQKI